MKTVREWIDICKQTHPLIGVEWEKLTPDSYFSSYESSMAIALCGSFLHNGYWSDIYDDMIKNPDKYLKKRKMFN
jgi:hypothetical protein